MPTQVSIEAKNWKRKVSFPFSVTQVEDRHAFVEKLIGLKQEEIDGKSNIYATTWVFLALVILLSGLEAATFYLFNYKVEKLFFQG